MTADPMMIRIAPPAATLLSMLPDETIGPGRKASQR